MSEFLDIISPKALEELKKANAEIVTMVSNVKKVNENLIGAKTPSGSDGALKALTAEYQKQEEAIKKLQEQLERLSNTKKQSNARTSEEIVNQRALATASNRQAQANSQLVGAYANLSAQVAIASKRYQDIIVRGKTAEQTQRQYNRELRQAQSEFQKLQTRVLQADKAVDKWSRTGERSIGFMRNLVGAFGIVGGVTLFAQLATDIFNTTKELQGLDKALMLVTETQGNFAEQQQFLKRVSEAYGLEIQGLTKQFTQFYVSAKDKISGQEIQQIFESISKAGASMGLSVQQQERAFLALNQMMSKGTIQAEELRGQLGEALPGALGIMAKAVGVTEKELGNMMKSGDLLASEVLPKFALQLEKTYGIENINRIETMASAQTRLSNAWTDFVRSLDEDGNRLTAVMTYLLNLTTDTIKGWRQIFTTAKTERKNELSELRAEGKKYMSDYYSELENYDKKDLENKKKVIQAEIQGLQRRAESAKKLIEEINKTGVRSPFGQLTKEDTQTINRNNALLKQYNNQISISYGKLDALNQLTKERVKVVEEDNKGTEKQIKTQKEQRELVVGSVEWLEKEISILKEKQSQLSTTTEEYQAFNTEIQTLVGSLDILTKKAKETEKAVEDMGISISDFDLSEEGIRKWTNEVGGYIPEMAKDWKDSFQEWSGVALDAIQTVQDAQTRQFESQLSQLEQSKRIAILFAGESASAREEIERQYDEKRRAILTRQARQEKAFAIVNTIINTARGVVSALASTPPNVPLSIAIGVIGAAQTALIASQQIPQFYKGTDNAPEGWAWTQEKGAEIITDKSGRVKDTGSNSGAKLTYLSKGDKVFTAEQSKNIMFNKELNSILSNNGILDSRTVVNNNLDLSPINSRLDNLANIIKNKSEIQMITDRQGERVYRKEASKRALLVSNRLRIKS
jgi:tape measure domain-containing protein